MAAAAGSAIKVSANLGFLFVEAGNLAKRYAAAVAAGFSCVETPVPYEMPLQDLVELKNTLGLEQVQINAPEGSSPRGIACHPSKHDEFRQSIELAIDYAKALQCNRIHVMSGVCQQGTPQEEQEEAFVSNIRWAASQMQQHSIRALIEPISHVAIPNYFLASCRQAERLLRLIGHKNVFVQLDLFHAQLADGNLTHWLEAFGPRLGHVQIAQVPNRHEPTYPGEINYDYIVQQLKAMNYSGYVGAEYRPSEGITPKTLAWIQQYKLGM